MKDNSILLNHIIESIEQIIEYTKDLNLKSFLIDVKTQDAVLRRIEIIGEAAGKLPSSFRKKYNNIKWSSIIGMRNISIHEYFGIDLRLTWNTVKKDIPELERKIKDILNEIEIVQKEQKN